MPVPVFSWKTNGGSCGEKERCVAGRGWKQLSSGKPTNHLCYIYFINFVRLSVMRQVSSAFWDLFSLMLSQDPDLTRGKSFEVKKTTTGFKV
jgi:hypothetical protein